MCITGIVDKQNNAFDGYQRRENNITGAKKSLPERFKEVRSEKG